MTEDEDYAVLAISWLFRKTASCYAAHSCDSQKEKVVSTFDPPGGTFARTAQIWLATCFRGI